ncbi:hypothetical protein CXG81DRAFT_17784 [Caulochytrium protostelioides]|uniref:Nitrogen permease regulator 3 n=1 Tax=Caulochytrium protostelioides TaxID=1555241 RepID=A0A4P9XB09_9FUNG|nr:hypothetical protein CXG81DRAFT_17784 [Caulochytrium protostelioides]|eukprot:RKP02574.1 hypothetical protein CXG81DRAFT_17784 [Caulochytrium protostelioides]
MTLLAIMLVCYSSKGHQIVAQYPPQASLCGGANSALPPPPPPPTPTPWPAASGPSTASQTPSPAPRPLHRHVAAKAAAAAVAAAAAAGSPKTALSAAHPLYTGRVGTPPPVLSTPPPSNAASAAGRHADGADAVATTDAPGTPLGHHGAAAPGTPGALSVGGTASDKTSDPGQERHDAETKRPLGGGGHPVIGLTARTSPPLAGAAMRSGLSSSVSSLTPPGSGSGAGGNGGSGSSGSTGGGRGGGGGGSSSTGGGGGGPSDDMILGFPSSALSNILSPKVALCDRPFQLTIDDITFVGHPTLLNVERPGHGLRYSRLVQRRKMERQDGGDRDRDRDRATSRQQQQQQKGAGAHATAAGGGGGGGGGMGLGGVNTTLPPPPNDALPAGLSDARRLSSLVYGSLSDDEPDVGAPDGGHHASGLTMFHLVCAIQPRAGESIDAEAHMLYENVIVRVTNALKYEQLHRNYIIREARVLLRASEDGGPGGGGGGGVSPSTVACGNGGGSNSSLVTAGMGGGHRSQPVPASPSSSGPQDPNGLAALLQNVFLAVKARRVAHVLVNNRIHLALRVPWASEGRHSAALPTRLEPGLVLAQAHHQYVARHGTSRHLLGNGHGGGGGGMLGSSGEYARRDGQLGMPGSGGGAEVRFSNTALQPHHALLLLSDPEELLKHFPSGAASLLVHFISVVTPTQTFDSLATTLECTLGQIYKLVAHLVYWQTAWVVPVVRLRNIYVVAPDVPRHRLAYLAADALSRFPQLDLVDFLSRLTAPKPFTAHVPDPDSAAIYLEIATYLLRHQLVVQMHVYLHLLLPGPLRAAVHARHVRDAARRQAEAAAATEQSSIDLLHAAAAVAADGGLADPIDAAAAAVPPAATAAADDEDFTCSKILADPLRATAEEMACIHLLSVRSAPGAPWSATPDGQGRVVSDEPYATAHGARVGSVGAGGGGGGGSGGGGAGEGGEGGAATMRTVPAVTPIGALLIRLLPYFDGSYHTDDIMVREGMTPRDIAALLAAYPDAIVTMIRAPEYT